LLHGRVKTEAEAGNCCVGKENPKQETVFAAWESEIRVIRG
jgi:hypothetical protein